MYAQYTVKKFFDASSTCQYKYFIFANKISISKNILFAQTVPSSIEGIQLCGKKTL